MLLNHNIICMRLPTFTRAQAWALSVSMQSCRTKQGQGYSKFFEVITATLAQASLGSRGRQHRYHSLQGGHSLCLGGSCCCPCLPVSGYYYPS